MTFVRYILLFLCSGTVISEHVHPCVSPHRARLYLDHTIRGVVVFDNDTASEECHLELVTCPSCVIALNISYINTTRGCEIARNSTEDDCDCYWVNIFEPPYEKESGKNFCGGSNLLFITQTRSIQILLRAPKIPEYQIGQALLQYRAKRNRQIVTAVPGQSGYISSPYFPENYPHDLNQEYIIKCQDHGCFIALLFSDFQLSTRSVVEFFDWNGIRLDAITGAYFRPSYILSTGSQLVLRFYGNGGTGSGYRATYLAYKGVLPSQPLTDCGGYVDDLGSAVTMMDMTQDTAVYDCVWIVRPSKLNNLHFRTHIYLKIVDFSGMGPNSKMTVHEGSTSDGRLLEVLKVQLNESEKVEVPREHITPITTGFYVHLKGSFSPRSRLAIAYAAFSYARDDSDCYAVVDHLCNNRRCLARQLMCDGFDQCGDGTDEICHEHTTGENIIRPNWYSHVPNYLFPKIDPYSDLKTATLVFVTSSLGLVIFAAVLFALLYRANIRVRRTLQASTRPTSSQIQIIADALLEEDIVEIESITDEPPIYEAPPRYEDCVSKETPVNTKTRRSTRRKKKKFRKHCRKSSSPPPRYEDSFNNRRWRSHNELFPNSRPLRTYLLRTDAASDSELLNICNECNTICNCQDKSTEKRIKFNTS